MYEVLAIGLGLMLGMAVRRAVGPRWRVPVLILLSVAIGSAVSAAAGELEISAGFLVFDCGQVVVAALAAAGVVEWVERRRVGA